MLSVISVAGMPSRCSSQAVRRAPCRNGRVSSAIDIDVLSGFDGGADHAQRRSVPGGRERAGVAVGQHRAAVGNQRRPVPADRAVDLDIVPRARASPR